MQQVGVWHSQPPVFGAVVLQLEYPAEHVYEHAVPEQVAPVLFSVLQAAPHPPQLAVVVVGVSHPLAFGAPASQSA
jgi:hypothetical protein